MTTLEQQIQEKQNVAAGKLTEAKGIVREQWGNVSNNDMTRLAGKKDQVVGRLQSTYSNSWASQNKGLVLLAAAAIGAAIAYLFTRSNGEPNPQTS